MPCSPRSHTATIRSVPDRVVHTRRAYTVRLRKALHPLLEEGDARAVDLAPAIAAKLSSITHGSPHR
jgi:hypothetical protein